MVSHTGYKVQTRSDDHNINIFELTVVPSLGCEQFAVLGFPPVVNPYSNQAVFAPFPWLTMWFFTVVQYNDACLARMIDMVIYFIRSSNKITNLTGEVGGLSLGRLFLAVRLTRMALIE